MRHQPGSRNPSSLPFAVLSIQSADNEIFISPRRSVRFRLQNTADLAHGEGFILDACAQFPFSAERFTAFKAPPFTEPRRHNSQMRVANGSFPTKCAAEGQAQREGPHLHSSGRKATQRYCIMQYISLSSKETNPCKRPYQSQSHKQHRLLHGNYNASEKCMLPFQRTLLAQCVRHTLAFICLHILTGCTLQQKHISWQVTISPACKQKAIQSPAGSE